MPFACESAIDGLTPLLRTALYTKPEVCAIVRAVWPEEVVGYTAVTLGFFQHQSCVFSNCVSISIRSTWRGLRPDVALSPSGSK